MFCENCGKPLEEGDRFCQYCGAEVNQEENLESPETERTIENNYDAGQDVPPAGTVDEKTGSRTGRARTPGSNARNSAWGASAPGSNTGSAGVIKWIAAAVAVVVIVVAAVVVTVLVRGKSEEVDQEVVSQQEDVHNATDDSETGENNKTDGADASDSTESKVEGTPIPTIEPQDVEALETEEKAAGEAEEQAAKEASEQAERDAQERAEKKAGEKATGETQEETSGKTAGQTAEKSDAKQTSSETVEVYYGLTASTEDFIFPYSSTRVLTDDDLKILEADTVEEEHYWSQLAINEMLARYGYPFDPEKSQTSKDAYDRFTGLDWYEAAKPQCPYSSGTEVLANMNSVEKKNVSILNDWQKAHGCYY